MENLNIGETNNLSNHSKTLEYIDRARKGEDADLMLDGLPESMKKAVLAGLEELGRSEVKEEPYRDETAEGVSRAFKMMQEGFKGAAQAKVLEYADRIEAGESQEDVFQGLAPSFRAGVEAVLADRVKSKKEKEERGRIRELKESLGVQEESGTALAEELKNEIRKLYLQGFDVHRRNQSTFSAYGDAGINPLNDEIYEKVDPEIAMDFDAHGIAKDKQLENLLALLERGVDKSRPFYTAPFSLPKELRAGMGAALGTAGGTAYKDGVAVVTGGYKESIASGGIKHVFLNDLYSKMLDPLKRLYPEYQFNLLSEQKRVMEEEARGKL